MGLYRAEKCWRTADTIPEFDRQTDTDRQLVPCLRIASRDRNEYDAEYKQKDYLSQKIARQYLCHKHILTRAGCVIYPIKNFHSSSLITMQILVSVCHIVWHIWDVQKIVRWAQLLWDRDAWPFINTSLRHVLPCWISLP